MKEILIEGKIVDIIENPFRTLTDLEHGSPKNYQTTTLSIIVEKNGKKYEVMFEAIQSQAREL